VLAVSVLGSGIAALDATVVNIALPAIGRDFGTGVAALQWVMNGYTLTLAAFLLIGGSLGDRFGRRKVYVIGTAWFALASAACGFAPDVVFLIITRVLQGVGAALLTPGSLAILEASFRPADRARAIGAWSGLGGIAIAAGPLVGGYLISAASWRWIFFINIPVAVMVIVLSARHVPESRSPDAVGRTDYLGAAAMVVFLSGIHLRVHRGPGARLVVTRCPHHGVARPNRPGCLPGLGAPRGVADAAPVGLRQRQFAAVNAVSFIVYGALTGATLLLPVVLQVVSGYSPLGSGLALLPLTIIMLVLSGRSGQLAARIGPRLQLTAGPLVTGAGLALLTLVPSGDSYVRYVLPAMVVFGLGLAITVAPLTATAMSSAPADHAGIASAVNNDVARFGGLLAVAILPALAGITGSAYLDPTPSPRDSGPRCSSRERSVPPEGCSPPSRSPTRHASIATPAISEPCLHCGLDAPPLAASTDRRILAIQPRG
jgi:MFS family permease